MRMDVLQKRIRQLKIAEKIDEAINEYYSLQGKPVPNWKYKKNPDWWVEYLESIGIDPSNP